MANEFVLYESIQKISSWAGISIFLAPNLSKCKKIQSLLRLLVLLTVHLVAVKLWNPKINSVIGGLFFTTFSVSCTSTYICNIYVNFFQTKNLKKLFNGFVALDFKLKACHGDIVLKEDKQFYFYLIASHLVFASQFSAEVIYRVFNNYKIYPTIETLIAIGTYHFFTYLLILTCLQYAAVIFTVKSLLKYLNRNLRDVFGKTYKPDVLYCYKRERIKCIMKAYDKVADISVLCNKIFGIPILLVYPYLLSYFVKAATFGIKVGLLKGYGLDSMYLLLFLSDIFGCLLCLIVAVAITSVSVQTNNEVREASLILFKIFIDLKPKKMGVREENLVTLSHSLMMRRLSFSACGFFKLDHTLLFTLMGSISYYVAIFIQFS